MLLPPRWNRRLANAYRLTSSQWPAALLPSTGRGTARTRPRRYPNHHHYRSHRQPMANPNPWQTGPASAKATFFNVFIFRPRQADLRVTYP